MKSVQRLLLFALRGLASDPLVSLAMYEYILTLIDLPSLQKSREILGIVFMVKLAKVDISAMKLLDNVCVNIPHTALLLILSTVHFEKYNPFASFFSSSNIIRKNYIELIVRA